MSRSIGYADFIRLLNVTDPSNFYPFLEVRFDGVYVVPPDPSVSLLPGERAGASEHPTGDLTQPALRFPCTWRELENFIDWAGLRHEYLFPQFLNYRETFIALQSRYPDLTEAELRMWVDGRKSLVALTHKPGKTRRSRLRRPSFRFHWSGCTSNRSKRLNCHNDGQSINGHNDGQSIDTLLECWFPSKQVFRFVPNLRYLTYDQLVERWQGCTAKDIRVFIKERVDAFREKDGYGVFEFGAFDPLGRLDLPMKDYVFALDQVEEKERAWFTGVLPIEDNHRSPLVGLTTNYHHWKPLAQYPRAHDHLELDAREKKLRVAVKVLPKKPDEWEANLIPIPPDTEGDPVNATSDYQSMCFHEPHDPNNPPLSLRLEGFWYLDAEEAFTVFRDGEATIRYLFPPDPAALCQRWPKLFPDCDFFLALTQFHQVRVEDLYWRELKPCGVGSQNTLSQQTMFNSAESTTKELDKQKREYKPELRSMEDTALTTARTRVRPREAKFKEFIEALDALKTEPISVIEKASLIDGVTWKDSESQRGETIKIGAMRNRFTRAKERNPYS